MAAYSAFALLTQGAPPTLQQLAATLKDAFQATDYAVEVSGHPGEADSYVAVILGRETFNGFTLFIESGPDVRKESIQIAGRHGRHRGDKEAVAGASSRIVLTSSDDETMDSFNDYVALLKALEELPGAVLFDPVLNKFLDET